MAFPSIYKYGFLFEIQALFLDVIKICFDKNFNLLNLSK